MSKKKTRDQAYRAAALEAALDAMAKAGRVSGAERIELDPDNVLRYAKFILGKRPAKRKRRKIQGGERRAYTAEAGTPLPRTEEELKDWKPLGYLTEDGLKEDPSFSVADVFRKKSPAETAPQPLTLSALDVDAAVRKLKEKAARGDLAADPAETEPLRASPVRDLSPAGWEAALKNAAKAGRSQQETEEHMNECSLCRELAEADARGELQFLEDAAEYVEEEPDATSSQPVGEDPGDREVLTQWAEVIRQQDAAREAAREAAALEAEPETFVVTLTPFSTAEEKREAEKKLGMEAGALDREVSVEGDRVVITSERPSASIPEAGRIVKRPKDLSVKPAPTSHSAAASAKAPDYVLKEGKDLGCPECSAELKRRRERDEALDRGRVKLGNRLPAGEFTRTDPLDEDELLAVAGSELYPAGDEEPSQELKIRNRKGEVWSYVFGGWTPRPRDPWSPRQRWTSSEMVRRGPWHVV